MSTPPVQRRRPGGFALAVAAVLVLTLAAASFLALSVTGRLSDVERADLVPDVGETVTLDVPDGVPVVEDPGGITVTPDPPTAGGITVTPLPDQEDAPPAQPDTAPGPGRPEQSDAPTTQPVPGPEPESTTAPEPEPERGPFPDEAADDAPPPDQVAEQGPVVMIVGEGDDALVKRADPPPVTQPTRPPGDALNVLLVGTDERPGETTRGRADVILLAHVSGDRSRVDLVHFPRDAYVNIPGYGANKINAAYAYGGTKLLVQSLQPLIGVPVDHVAVTGFDGFVNGVDAVGGVTVDVRETSEAFPVAGPTTMDGPTALTYVRERKTLSQGDLSRGKRQQQVVASLLSTVTSAEVLTSPSRLDALADAFTASTVVDEALTGRRMLSLAGSLRDVRGGDVHSWTMPNHWTRNDPVVGSVVVVDEDGMARLREHLVADTMADHVG